MNVEVKTNVIKRNGEEVHFNSQKIVNAVHKANEEVDRLHQMNDYQIRAIADSIAHKVQESTHAVNVEDIQDMVAIKGLSEGLPQSKMNMLFYHPIGIF